MEPYKRCPFRKDENGDFLCCYGFECIAYYEYEQPAIQPSTQCYIEQPSIKISGCYRLSAPSYYTGFAV